MSLLKFGPIFYPNSSAGLKQTYKTYPLCNQSFRPTCKGGAMPQFCMLFYVKYTILATQKRGGMAQWPPAKYAPVYVKRFNRSHNVRLMISCLVKSSETLNLCKKANAAYIKRISCTKHETNGSTLQLVL